MENLFQKPSGKTQSKPFLSPGHGRPDRNQPLDEATEGKRKRNPLRCQHPHLCKFPPTLTHPPTPQWLAEIFTATAARQWYGLERQG